MIACQRLQSTESIDTCVSNTSACRPPRLLRTSRCDLLVETVVSVARMIRNIQNLRFSQQYLRMVPSSGIQRRVDTIQTDVSEEQITFMFTACTLVSCLAIFDLENGGGISLQNVSSHADYILLHHRRREYSEKKIDCKCLLTGRSRPPQARTLDTLVTFYGTRRCIIPWPLVRKRTIPTDRPPLVDEI
jgi:hypothetical protein